MAKDLRDYNDRMDIKNKAIDIIAEKMDDVWFDLYMMLEKETEKNYSGDIHPLDSLTFDDICEDMANLFIKVSSNNIL